METLDKSRLLPLDADRVIVLTVNKTALEFRFKRIEQGVWRRFCEALVTRVEQKRDQRTSLLDEESALVELFDKTFLAAGGYSGTDQVTKAARIPVRHRVAAASVLRSIGTEVTPIDQVGLSEYTEIRLNAPWSAGPAGGMEMFTGLVHRFREPSIEQYRRWRAGLARVAVSGTAQDGLTIYPSRLAVALGLYDELIAEVEGYQFASVDLAGADVKFIAEKMDGLHKARAVLELFDRDSEEITVGAADETTDEAAA